jgi:hypothetical protein
MESDLDKTAKKINDILRMGRKAKSKEEQDNIIKMLSQFSQDFSSPEYPKMGISEFLKSDTQKAALSPQEMLKSYYGDNLNREIIRAGNYNINRPVIKPQSYPAIFDTIQGRKTEDYGSTYSVDKNNTPTAEVTSGAGFEIEKENNKTYRKWLSGNDPELKARALQYFRTNSLDPSISKDSVKSTLEHEIGHHITDPDAFYSLNSLRENNGKLPLVIEARNKASAASNGFDDFGGHTGLKSETTQALSRFQREMFKNTGKRLIPIEFTNLVNSGDIPDFLTQEGRRILIYARNLKEVADKSQDKEKKKNAQEALKALSRMAPAVVKNEKKYGLNLPIG